MPKLHRHPLELPYALSMAAGLRRDELLALRWHDLNRDYTTAHAAARGVEGFAARDGSRRG